MKLDCYLRSGQQLDIRPASSKRDWMDATGGSFAYRCLPLSIANAHGWVICSGTAFEAEWNGGKEPEDVQVLPHGDDPHPAHGHFGYGILTFGPRAMFRTERDYNLWVSGPPNAFKDGIQPLTAVIETDWMPYTFTMNWMFTRPQHRIRFEKGEPYCFLFPVPRGLQEDVEPRLRDLAEDPEAEHQDEYARRMRNFLKRVKSLKRRAGEDVEVQNEKALNFQMWYMKGRMPDGSEVFTGHQKRLELRPFADLRTPSAHAAPSRTEE
jgi:hypothetical protein